LTALVYKSDTLAAFNEQHNRYDLRTRNTLHAIAEPPTRRVTTAPIGTCIHTGGIAEITSCSMNLLK